MDNNADDQLTNHLEAARAELTASTPTPDARIDQLMEGPLAGPALIAENVVPMSTGRARRRSRIAVGAVAAAVALLAASAVYLSGGTDPTSEVATSAPGDGSALSLVDESAPEDDPVSESDPDEAEARSNAEQRAWFECMRSSFEDLFESRSSGSDGSATGGSASFGLGSLFGDVFSADGSGHSGSVIELPGGRVFGGASVFGFDPDSLTITLDDCGPPPVLALPPLGSAFGCGSVSAGSEPTTECGPGAPFDVRILEACARSDDPFDCFEAEFDVQLPDLPGCEDASSSEEQSEGGRVRWFCGEFDLPSVFACDTDPCGPFEFPKPFDCDDEPCFGFDLPGATVCESGTGVCHDLGELFDQFPACLEDDSCDLPGLAEIENCAPDDPTRECWKVTIGDKTSVERSTDS